ncbi:MAG: hypothetical protein AB1861_17250 [Cyanobacteriota bacterium]
MDNLSLELLKTQQEHFLKMISSKLHDPMYIKILSQHLDKNFISHCWGMAYKYWYLESDDLNRGKNHGFNKEQLLNNYFQKQLTGKLGELAVKIFLGNLVSNLNYVIGKGGDGGSDFCLSTNPTIRLQVKTRLGRTDHIEWQFSKEELDKNAILVCLSIQEPVNNYQDEYNLCMAGFMPTYLMIDKPMELIKGKLYVKIKAIDLLYGGGIKDYLQSISEEVWQVIEKLSSMASKRILEFNKLPNRLTRIILDFNSSITEAFKYQTEENYEQEIVAYSHALLVFNECCNLTTQWMGTRWGIPRHPVLEKYGIGGEIEFNNNPGVYDYTPILEVFWNRGVARTIIGDYAGAFSDFDNFISIQACPQRRKPPSSTIVEGKDGNIYPVIFTKCSLNSDNVIAHKNRAYALLRMGYVKAGEYWHQKAVEDLDRVIKFLSNNRNESTDVSLSTAYTLRADIYNLYGENKKALYYYKKASKINPENVNLSVKRLDKE